MICDSDQCKYGTVSGCSKISCLGSQSCMEITIEGDKTELDCSGEYSCESVHAQRLTGKLTCGEGSCFNGHFAGDVDVDCADAFACDSMEANTTGSITCRVASSYYKFSSTNPHAKVICNGEDACNDANISSLSIDKSHFFRASKQQRI